MLGALAAYTSVAAPVKITAPDAALIAAVDTQDTNVSEAIVFGDFEAWYPNLYPDYKWTRETVSVSTNGLFQMNYVVLDWHNRIQDELNVLLFRPSFEDGLPAGPQPWRWRGVRHRPASRDSRPSASTKVVRAIEEVLEGAQSFHTNILLYGIHGNADSISLVSRLPHTVTSRSADSAMERVSVFLERAGRGTFDIVMEHTPYLRDTTRVPPERVVLAEDVSLFQLEYWDQATATWEEWTKTNLLPAMVRITVGVGQMHRKWESPHELTSRIVALPSVGVPANLHVAPPVDGGTNRPPNDGRRGRPNAPSTRPDSGQRDRQSFPHETAISDFGRGNRTLGQVVYERRADYQHRDKLNCALETKLSWLGRSGVELAKAILAADLSGPSGQSDSLAERWAGGPGADNDAGALLPQDLSLGTGRVSVRLTDHERRFNINIAGTPILQQAVTLLAVDPRRHGEVIDSILDWIDRDGDSKTQGAESDYYLQLSPPYFAKNGPVDDLSELLLVKGITPEMYYGPQRPDGVGMVELFTAVSSRAININTASETTLQLLPPIDANVAAAIIQRRAGPDSVDGTQDDTPFRNPQELGSIPGLPPPVLQQIQLYVTVRSMVFEARVEAEIDGVVQRFVAILARNNTRTIAVLSFYAE